MSNHERHEKHEKGSVRSHAPAWEHIRTACEVSGHDVGNQFVDANKMVELGSGSQSEISGIMLTRYACYLVRVLVPTRSGFLVPTLLRGNAYGA